MSSLRSICGSGSRGITQEESFGGSKLRSNFNSIFRIAVISIEPEGFEFYLQLLEVKRIPFDSRFVTLKLVRTGDIDPDSHLAESDRVGLDMMHAHPRD